MSENTAVATIEIPVTEAAALVEYASIAYSVIEVFLNESTENGETLTALSLLMIQKEAPTSVVEYAKVLQRASDELLASAGL